MSQLSQFIMSGGGKLRYQDFTSSGTFVPSAKLLANGGQCFVTLIGGGGGGGYASSGTGASSGGAAGDYVESVVTVVGNIAVTIGNGGNGGVRATGTPAQNGQNSTFGALLTASGGLAGASNQSGSIARGGDGSKTLGYHVTDVTNILDARGGKGINGKAGGGGGGRNTGVGVENFRGSDGGGDGGIATNSAAANGTSAVANSGSGGGGGGGASSSPWGDGGNGGSGWCRVIWFE